MRKKKIIDISVALRSGMPVWPGDPAVRVDRRRPRAPGKIAKVTRLSLGPHTGTHMDAPLHFIPGAQSLDQMPLNATVGPARVLAIKDKQRITPEELAPYRIAKGERILFKTAKSRLWDERKFVKDFVSITPGAARYLVSRKIVSVGIDYLSVGSFYADGADTHRILLKAGIWVIEGLDLRGVAPGAYDLVCLPLKVLGADGAPARALLMK
jgi:arylformamidase